MLTEKDYCDYETCVALKEFGYDGTAGECSHFGAFHMNGKEIFYDRLYNCELKENECLRVPLYLAQKWLREEKGVVVLVSYDKVYKTEEIVYDFVIVTKDEDIWFDDKSFDSYEEALSEGIRTTIKLLKRSKMEKYKDFISLANRLAESVLMDWDKEEHVKLAKEVACECHKFFNEGDNFFSLVKRMREAQRVADRAMAESDDYSDALIYINKAEEIEREVDEYLKKMWEYEGND